MSSFGSHFSTASPVLTLPPQPSHQTRFAMGGFAHQHAPPHSFGATPYQSPAAAPAPAPAPAGLQRFASSAGRKRSRDEASINLEPEAPPPVEDDEEDWTYGEGMVLIKPGPRYVTDASSQSGTWVEEKRAATEEAARRQRQSELADQRSSKLQRMDRSFGHDTSTSVPVNNDPAPIASAVASAPADAGPGPIIDDFTLHLGIGWCRISDEEHIQAAARGWARFIENHYPLSGVNIRLESKGLQSYLVEASEGFFLFAESLRQGQLVSSTAEGALRNLQSTPPTLDGASVLVAAESPSPTSEPPIETASADTDVTMG